MVATIHVLILLFVMAVTESAYAKSAYYGAKLCKDKENYSCHIVKRGETWAKLFHDASEQEVIMHLNRIGIELRPGMHIAIPKNSNLTVMDVSPFPHTISAPGEKMILVSLNEMAWGAYDPQGNLVKWGPASSALGYCPDIQRGCHTTTGRFAIYQKQGKHCVSTKYPVGRGGAPMPYCMFFNGGFALHGSHDIPGYNASHGCIRLLVKDAQWLNEEFTAGELGTRVIVNQQ